MSKQTNFWVRLTGRQRGLVAGALVLVLVFAGIGVVSWMVPWGGGTSGALAPTTGDGSVEGSAADGEATTGAGDGASGEVPLTSRGSRDATEITFTVGDNGMIVMPETDNPIELAAAAASAMYTFDTKQMPWHKPWVSELVTKLAHPSPDYVGAMVLADLYDSESELLTQEESLALVLAKKKDWQLQTQEDYTPWLSSESAWIAQPFEIWVGDEIRAVDPKLADNAKKEHAESPYMEQIGDGSLTWVWVTVDVKHKHGDGSVDEIEHRATTGFGIHCDPLEVGGLCGVYMTTKVPDELKSVRY